MFRGNNSNTAAPSFLENHFLYPQDASNQLQLFGNLPGEFHGDPVNYLGNNHGTPFLMSNKSVRDAEAIPRQQKLQFSLNNKTLHDEADRKASIFNQNPVSTGLRLSYDDDERNSSITSASGSLTAASSVFSSLSNEIRRELDQQKEEFDQFIRTQEANMVKGVIDIRQRHMTSFLSALEKGIARKLHEKDVELETITRKNKELVENMKQVTTEAQNWCYMAKYNESVVNVLKTNLQQAMQGSNQVKEGQGESDTDDAASCIDPNNYLSGPARSSTSKKGMMCRSCKVKGVSILLMPCRHLCLCKDCEAFVNACPVCQMVTTASFEVYLS
ncbi:putative E3 ubiquitin ligase [Handroanthus impetiginosus]|uniref:Putative E3 ubiquitin ligase n=1 Tax=Handroanthus impetiginosus TaxID=429701 RepID=A0A2G9HNA2_9LAMI|nr:putative E3 ubiquitin ligase [Handroanthus impetiginosus]